MAKFDSLTREWQQANGAPALSVAVLRKGALLYAEGFGAGTAATVYQTASAGKQFTAALALLLQVPLDDFLAPLLPELPDTWRAVTMRHLLGHTGGIPEFGYDSLDFTRDYSETEIARAIAAADALEFEPGTGWRYSNAGYVLAGIALGRTAGAFYGDLLRDLIFTPLGMTTARVNGPDAPVGHIREGGVLVPAPYVSPMLNRVADGGLTMSVLDFARWEAALCGPWGACVAAMSAETRLSDGSASGYGLGWFLSSSADHGRIAEHDGAWQGFSTAMVRYLDAGVSAVVLANIADADAAELAHALALECLPAESGRTQFRPQMNADQRG